MPNLSAHLGIAQGIAARLRDPTVDRHLGSFLLGSTTPDIRIITRGHREDTHFAPLSSEDLRAGVWGMFRAHPRLADASPLEAPTRAFVGGYISHLIADQAWVVYLYRPFFGNRQVFDDHTEGNVLDRALQLELDRQAREHLNDFQDVRRHLDNAEGGVQVDFLPPELLAEWRQWVQEHLGWGFSWERLRRMTRRQYSQDNDVAIRVVEEFLDHVPSGLESVYRRVPWERVEEFHRRTEEEVVQCLKEYLT